MNEAVASYQLLPALSAYDYQRLQCSIAEHGVLVPVVVDEDGTVIDGHHRRALAAELGMPCPQETCPPGLNEHQKRILAADLNVARRHLTDAQKVLLGRQIEPDIAAVNEVQRLANLKRGIEPPKGPNGHVGKTRDEVAARVKLGSGRKYDRAKKDLAKVEEHAPEYLPALETGTVDLRDVRREIRRREKREKVAEISSRDVPEQTGAYTVIYADPPWRYEHAPTDSRAVENQYPTKTLAEIKGEKPAAADDSVLFLWATPPKLGEALEVMDAWGFEYRTCLVWVKDKIGMGYYARQQHELLLIGKRGELPVPDEPNRPASVVEAPRTGHSRKPPVFYELIERMYPSFSKYEMYARDVRPGWASWGTKEDAS